MPLSSKRICARGGCHVTVDEKRYCKKHSEHEAGNFRGMLRDDKTRRFYNSKAWRGLSKAFLRDNPFCIDCKNNNRIELSKHSDHIKSIRTHWHLRLEWSNLNPLCIRCHNIKTSKSK